MHLSEETISTWIFGNLHVKKNYSPRGCQMKLRRNQIKLRRNRFVPTWRIKNSHLNILFFLGDYFIAGGGEYLELNQRMSSS